MSTLSKTTLDVDFGLHQINSLRMGQRQSNLLVAGIKAGMGSVTGNIKMLSLDGKIDTVIGSETAIYQAEFIDQSDSNMVAAACGQEWCPESGLISASSVSIYDLRLSNQSGPIRKPEIQLKADSFQEFRTVNSKVIGGMRLIAAAGDQIASVYDLRMPNREFFDLSVCAGFYTRGPFKVKSIKFSPNGHTIATAGQNHVRMFELNDLYHEYTWIKGKG